MKKMKWIWVLALMGMCMALRAEDAREITVKLQVPDTFLKGLNPIMEALGAGKLLYPEVKP